MERWHTSQECSRRHVPLSKRRQGGIERSHGKRRKPQKQRREEGRREGRGEKRREDKREEIEKKREEEIAGWRREEVLQADTHITCFEDNLNQHGQWQMFVF